MKMSSPMQQYQKVMTARLILKASLGVSKTAICPMAIYKSEQIVRKKFNNAGSRQSIKLWQIRPTHPISSFAWALGSSLFKRL